MRGDHVVGVGVPAHPAQLRSETCINTNIMLFLVNFIKLVAVGGRWSATGAVTCAVPLLGATD